MKYTFLEKRNSGSEDKDKKKKSVIVKVGNKWKILRKNRKNYWDADYDTKKDAQAALRAYWFHKKNESKQLNEKYASDKYVTEMEEIKEDLYKILRTTRFENIIKKEGVYIYEYRIDTRRHIIPIYVIVFDENRIKSVNKKLKEEEIDEIDLYQNGKTTGGYTKPNANGEAKYIVSYIPINIKEGEIYFKKGLDNDVYRTISHELIHALDFEKIPKTEMNYFPYLTLGKNDLDKQEREVVDLSFFLLYKYWSPTEFNAYQTNFFSRLIHSEDIRKSTGSKENKIKEENIESLEKCNSKGVWTLLKGVLKDRSLVKNEKLIEKVEKMSLEKFKKYFISRTKKLIEKHIKKSLRNSSSSELLLKDIKNNQGAFIEQINDIINNKNSKHIGYKPLRLILDGKFYLNEESRYQEYKVVITTEENVDSLKDIYDKIRKPLKYNGFDSNVVIKDCIIFLKNKREYKKYAKLDFYGKKYSVIRDIINLLSIIVTEMDDTDKENLESLTNRLVQLSNYIFGNLVGSKNDVVEYYM